MIIPAFALRLIFSLLAVLTSLWHVSAEKLTQEQFANSFRLTPAGRVGTCQRDTSTSTGTQNSLDVVLQAADDAWDLASNAWVDMDKFGDDTSAGKTYRGLLFVFFGITFTHDIQSDSFEFNTTDRSEQNYEYVRYIHLKAIFGAVDFLFTEPKQPLPYFFCGDDWSIWTRYLIGSDSKENTSAPLAAQHLNSRMANDTYFPGLLWDSVMGTGYFQPRQSSPRTRVCDSSDPAWTVGGFHYIGSVTLCFDSFRLPLISSLGEPSGPDSSRYYNTLSEVGLHELIHLATRGAIGDMPQVKPSDGNWRNTNWRNWILNLVEPGSFGVVWCQFLGLARPELARINADNYAIFALCIKYLQLDCLGKFAQSVQKREELPFVPSPRAIEKMRRGRFNFG